MNNVRIFSSVVMVVVASFFVQACGDSSPSGMTSSGASSCGNASRTGTSECLTGQCSAGQYCDRPSVDDQRCVAGCTSDENCGAKEWCVKCGSDAVGTCKPCTDDGKSVCAPPAPVEKKCGRNSEFDVLCQSGGRPTPTPPNGYSCTDPSMVPADTGCVSIGGTDWCCP